MSLDDAKVTFKVKKSTVVMLATVIAWALVLVSYVIVEAMYGL